MPSDIKWTLRSILRNCQNGPGAGRRGMPGCEEQRESSQLPCEVVIGAMRSPGRPQQRPSLRGERAGQGLILGIRLRVWQGERPHSAGLGKAGPASGRQPGSHEPGRPIWCEVQSHTPSSSRFRVLFLLSLLQGSSWAKAGLGVARLQLNPRSWEFC